MVRTTIYLTEDQLRRVKERAKEQGISVSALIRRMIDAFLGSDDTDEEIRRRAKAAVGFVRSGETDLSVNHDKYLAEAYAESSDE